MELLNTLSLSLASLLSMALTPQQAHAQQVPACLNLYNGGISCSQSDLFDVEKTVQNPKDGTFVQILEPNQTRIQPGNTMIFRIVITNTSEKTLENIQITDQFSDTLRFTTSQKGTFNESDNRLTYTIDSLPKGESETFDLQATIKPESELPSVTGPLCAINVVSATQAKESESANVQFCIEKQTGAVPGTKGSSSFPTSGDATGTEDQVTQDTNTTKGGQTVYTPPTSGKTPDTGPELLAVIGLLPALGAGFYLRRKSS